MSDRTGNARASGTRSISGLVLRLLVSAGLFLMLAALVVRHYHPSFPTPLALELSLPRGRVGQAEPLITAGRTDAGDFLWLSFPTENTVVFGYDSWGQPGLTSQPPVPFEPGTRLRLLIEMPALTQDRGRLAEPSHRVRVTCDGRIVLDVEGHFFVREFSRIFFGENPIGGTACGPTLHGQLFRADGRSIRGGPDAIFSQYDRIAGWVADRWGLALTLLLLSVAATWQGEKRLRRRFATPGAALAAAGRVLVRHRWFVGALVVSATGFAWIVCDRSFQLNFPESFGTFYDYQAESMLKGRLDVPEEAILGEAFVFDGKFYGYFGPTPALLRMPLLLFNLGFGTFSRSFMLLYFIVSLIICHSLLRHALKLAGHPDAGVPSKWAVLILIGGAGMGSTLFFLGSRAYVFHEAILCGIMFALLSCALALRHLEEPERRWWIGALGCGVLSIQARPPTGLFALTFLGCVVVAVAAREFRRGTTAAGGPPRRPQLGKHLAIAGLCAAGIFSFNAVSYLKFKTFEGAPLRFSRPYGPERLANIDGKSFHLVNIPFNIDTYLLYANFHLEPHFPYIYLGSPVPRRDHPKARMDLPDHTLGLPYAMPGLFALATLGCAGALLAIRRMRPAILALWAAVLPMTLALFAAIATAQRYTGDFCPFLLCAAAFGLAAVESAAPRWRIALRAVLAAATLWAVLLTFALTLHYQGETVWGVPEAVRHDYQLLRRRVDGFFESRPR